MEKMGIHQLTELRKLKEKVDVHFDKKYRPLRRFQGK